MLNISENKSKFTKTLDRFQTIKNLENRPHYKILNKIIYENEIYFKNLNTESEIIKFSDLYRILGVVIQIRMNYKKSKSYVNFEDEKSYGAKKY